MDLRFWYGQTDGKAEDDRVDRELRTLVTFMTPGVEELTWKLAGLSAQLFAYIDSVVEYVRSTEKLPGAVPSIEPATTPAQS